MNNDANLKPLEILLLIIIPSLIAGVPSIISAVGAWKDKRKRVAEALNEESTAAERVTGAWEKFAHDLREENEKLRERFDKMEERQNKSEIEQRTLINRVDRQKKRINYLEGGVQILISQLKALGVEPNFILKYEDDEGD